MTESSDLSSYLLGERSELRAVIQAIADSGDERERGRMAVEYLLVLAAARQAATAQSPEERALEQVRAKYGRVYEVDDSDHARLLRELHRSLRSGSEVDVVTALKLLGLHHRKAGAFELARAAFSVASGVARLLSDPIEHLNSLFWLGVVERYLGNLDDAERVHREQLQKARIAGNRGQAVLAQENLGLITLRRGDVGGARNQVLKALNEAQQLEDRELEGFCYHALMTVEMYAGRPGEAAACGWEAYERYESVDQRLRALQDCGVILFNSHYLREARAAFEIVVRQASDTAPRLHAMIGLTDVAAALGERTEFERLVQDLLHTSALRTMAFEWVNALRTAGIGYARFGESQKAVHYLQRSLALARDRGFGSEVEAIEEVLATLPENATPPVLRVPATEQEQLDKVGRNIMAERARAIA